jgi:Protein of Unknown function (DUF2784)
MNLFYRLAADAVVLVHAAYVLFILVGQVLILAGILWRWGWIRNIRFRLLHLAAIAFVVFESLAGIVCPLTTLEQYLRDRAGQVSYRGDFLANFAHEFLFYDLEPWVFTWIYSGFGLLVLVCFCAAPPQRRKRIAPTS